MAGKRKTKGGNNSVPSEADTENKSLQIELAQIIDDMRVAGEASGYTADEIATALAKTMGRKPSQVWVHRRLIQTGIYQQSGTRYGINSSGSGCVRPVYVKAKK